MTTQAKSTRPDIVQTFGRKRNGIAVATIRAGHGLIRVNGTPLDVVEPAPLRIKVYEPILLLGTKRFKDLDIRIKVKGGGYTS